MCRLALALIGSVNYLLLLNGLRKISLCLLTDLVDCCIVGTSRSPGTFKG
jgi:hypothetical protein